MTIGERIKDVRTRLGISQVAFADKIGVSKQTLYKYENNIITNIPSDKIEAIAKISGRSPSYLMGWEEVDDQPQTMAAHFDGNEYTEEELDEIKAFAEFVKSKRK